MAGNVTVDSLEAKKALQAYFKRLDGATRQRGEQYYHMQRVQSLQPVSERELEATVQGGALYQVNLVFNGVSWAGNCECPIEENCKHCCAAALEWQSELEAMARSTRFGGGFGSDLQATSKRRPLREAPAKSAPQPPFRKRWEPLIAAKLNRSLTPPEGEWLTKLAAVFRQFQSHGGLMPEDVSRLGFNTVESQRAKAYEPLYEDWWDSPPRDPMALWNYIACDIELSGGRVPAFLKPVTETAAIHQFLAKKEKAKVVQRWIDQFESFAAVVPAQASLQEVQKESVIDMVDFRVVLGLHEWRIEVRGSPGASWTAASRNFLDQFRVRPWSFTQVSGSPSVLAAIAVVEELYQINYTKGKFDRGPASASLLRRWLEHPLARDIVVGVRGEAVRFSSETLVWKLTAGEAEARAADEGEFELKLAWPDGTPLAVDAVYLPGQPAWYLTEGPLVIAGPPPLDGKSATGARVPAAALESSAVLKTLQRHRAIFPDELSSRVLQVPMEVQIQCKLGHAGSSYERLELLLSARSPQHSIEQVWTGGSWEEVLASAPAKRGSTSKKSAGQVLVPDLALADRVAASLSTLKLSYDSYTSRWARSMSSELADEWVVWREALPPGVTVQASPELAALMGQPIRATVDFSLLESGTHRDWFDLAVALKVEDTTLTPDEIRLLLRAKGRFVNLPAKGWRRLHLQLPDDQLAVLEDTGVDSSQVIESALRGEKQTFHTLQLDGDKLDGILSAQQVERLRARSRALATTVTPQVPTALKAELRTYQREGFEFLAFLASNGLGAVLADDMGLGKTVQTLAWLLWLQEKRAEGELKVLVVCPKSVMGNWEAEARRFAPTMRVERVGGLKTEVEKKTAKKGPAEATGPRLVVMNYTQLRLQAELVRTQAWDVIVLDEGQFIKNPASKVSQVARELPAEHRLVLTGTPIENRLLDLWSLFAFSLPGLLGSQAAFKRRYDQQDPAGLSRLRRSVRHFMLRRTKAQVAADLPARIEEDLEVEMEGVQAKLYQAELKWARAQLLRVKTHAEFDRERFNILASLLKLRQICCHPALIDPVHAEVPSAKLEALLEQVEELRGGGHKVLIFSQFVGMLEIIRARLGQAGVAHLMLTGQTSNRDALVEQFQTDPDCTVFLLSLKAAGFGLNLTAASYVVLYDPWWNPAVEAQAIDRTHRIGQVSPVNAYRLIAKDSIEQKIRALQREKSALSGAIVQEESVGALMDLDTLRRVLSE